MSRMIASLMLISAMALSACASARQEDRPRQMSQAAEQACGTYRAMMTAPMPPSEMGKLRIACEEAMKADRP